MWNESLQKRNFKINVDIVKANGYRKIEHNNIKQQYTNTDQATKQ